MTATTRRGFLQHTASLATALSLGCSAEPPPSQTPVLDEKRDLRIFVFADHQERAIREVLAPAFESSVGDAVVLKAGTTEGLKQWQAAPSDQPPFDLMMFEAVDIPTIKTSMFARLSLNALPNRTTLVPASLDDHAFKDRNALPFPDTLLTLTYHKKSTTSRPTRWRDLMQPAFQGKLGLCGSCNPGLYTFAAILADVNNQPGTAHQLLEEKIDEVFRFAKEHRSRVKLWWNRPQEMLQSLQSQTVVAGTIPAVDILPVLRERSELAAVTPEADRALSKRYWVIPDGAKNRSLAERALNMLLSEEVQYSLAQRGIATARQDVAARLATEDPLWGSLYPNTEEQFQTFQYYPYDIYTSLGNQLSERWERTVLAKG